MSDYKVGDRVKVIFETTVTDADTADCICTRSGKLTGIDILEYVVKDGGTVEKIEPPVEVFGPGDVVRDKSDNPWTWAIGSKGWIVLDAPDRSLVGRQVESTAKFTSKHYERVNLVEPPL